MKYSCPLALLSFLILWPASLQAGVAAAPNAPTNLRAAKPFLDDYPTIEFCWDDNADNEDGFEIELRLAEDGSPVFSSTVLKNQVTQGLTGPITFEDEFFFRVRAVSTALGDSEWTENVRLVMPSTPLGIRGGDFFAARVGEEVSYQPTAYGNVPNGFSVDVLPSGLTIDSETGEVSGIPQEAGVFRPLISVTDGTSTASTFVTIRIVEPTGNPIVSQPLPETTITVSAGSGLIPLGDHFSDPGMESAVRIETNLGTLDVLLYDQATPATVENFLNYVNRGDYSDVLFHRSTTSAAIGLDIIQAGWFKPGDPADYVTVETDDGVINEPGISNTRGTIAMAKQGSKADSGTSQWYFNVTDSSGALDPVSNNGGFTVFGRLSHPSLAVMDDIHSKPTGNYTVTLDGGSRAINDWPTLQAPTGALPAPEDYIQITSSTQLSKVLSYAVTQNSAPGVVSASVTPDGDLSLVGLTGGVADIEVTATDLDGETVAATVHVISDSVQGAPLGDLNADTDNDGLCALLELALGGHTEVNDAASIAPVLGSSTVGESDFRTLSFFHRSSPAGLSYTVEFSADLVTWTDVWTTSDGFAHAQIVSGTGGNVITVRSLLSVEAAPTGHLRLRVDYVLQ